MPEEVLDVAAAEPTTAETPAETASPSSEPSASTAAMIREGQEFMGQVPLGLKRKEPAAPEAEKPPAEKPAPAPAAKAEKPAADRNWMKKEEAALFEGLTPEQTEFLTARISPYERRDQEREKGVQKYIQGLGPLKDIAKDPASVGFTRMVFDNAPSAGGDGLLIGAIDKLGQAYIESQRSGKKFDPASVFGGPAQPTQAPAHSPEWQGYLQKLAGMSPEERSVEIASSPGKLFDVLSGVLERTSALESSVGQKLAPVEQMREQAALQQRAEREMDSWIESLPQAVKDLPEDQYLGLLGEVAEIYQENRDAWTAKGHTPISAMDLAFEKVQAKREIDRVKAEALGAKASQEKSLRETRTDSPAGGLKPTGQEETRGSQLAASLRKEHALTF